VTSTTRYEGRCFCGAVQIAVTGNATAMGYCHCESCRQWSAGPLNAFTLWPENAVNVTKGEQHIDSYQQTPRSVRKWCRKCGGHLFTVHPHWGLTDVYAAVLPKLPFAAQVHVNYEQTVLPIKDGLPKFRDFPAEMGGSGASAAE
jgi:hypothetical protein